MVVNENSWIRPCTFYVNQSILRHQQCLTAPLFCMVNVYLSQSWAASLDGLAWDDTTMMNFGRKALAVDPVGNTYIVGHYADPSLDIGGVPFVNQGGVDILVYKMSPSGEQVWVRSLGGDGDDQAFYVVTDDAGAVYVYGTSSSSSIAFAPVTLLLPSAYQQSTFIVKLDASTGDALWAKSLVGDLQHLGGVVASSSGDSVYLTGDFRGGNITMDGLTLVNSDSAMSQGYVTGDGFVVKLSSTSGEVVYGRTLGGVGQDTISMVVGDSEGSIYITASSSFPNVTFGSQALTVPSAYIMKVDPAGEVGWVTGILGASGFIDCTVDSSGSIIMLGFLFTSKFLTIGSMTVTNEVGFEAGFVAKLSPFTGETMWVSLVGQMAGMANGVRPMGLATDGCDRILVGGFFSSTPLTIGTEVISTTNGGSDIFLTRITPGGSVEVAVTFGGPNDDHIWGLGMTSTKHLILVGSFSLTFNEPGSSRGSSIDDGTMPTISAVSLVSDFMADVSIAKLVVDLDVPWVISLYRMSAIHVVMTQYPTMPTPMAMAFLISTSPDQPGIK